MSLIIVLIAGLEWMEKTMNNAEWLIKNGYLFSDVKHCCQTISGEMYFSLNGKTVGKVKMIGNSYFESFKKWLDQEHKEPILTDEEHEYLAAVIKPFRDRVEYIAKVPVCGWEEDSYIFIHFTDASDDMDFPLLRGSNMYKGMRPYDKYTLEELGL